MRPGAKIVGSFMSLTAGGWEHMSKAERSLKARKQLRDKYGRFIEMGGDLKFKVGKEVGHGKFLGMTDDGDVLVGTPSTTPSSKDKIRRVPADSVEMINARARIGYDESGDATVPDDLFDLDDDDLQQSKSEKFMNDYYWRVLEAESDNNPRGVGWDELGYDPAPDTPSDKVLNAAEAAYDKYVDVIDDVDGEPVSQEEFMEAAARHILPDTGASELMSRAPLSVLGNLILDRAIKTQFESANSQGLYDPEYRSEVENNKFLVPEDINDRNRPVYGYVADGLTNKGWVGVYGDLVLRMEPSVVDRTTVTGGDSLDGGMVTSVPLADLRDGTARPEYKIAAVEDGSVESAIEAAIRDLHGEDPDLMSKVRKVKSKWTAEASYTEAQIHGGLPLEDITEISISEDAYRFNQPITSWDDPEDWVQERLMDMGIHLSLLQMALGPEGADLYSDLLATLAADARSGKLTNMGQASDALEKFMEDVFAKIGAEKVKFRVPKYKPRTAAVLPLAEPLVARGGWAHMSKAERSAKAKRQLRDKYGRFVEMGGDIKFKLGKERGVGEFLGMTDDGDVLVGQQGRVRRMPADAIEAMQVRARLEPDETSRAVIPMDAYDLDDDDVQQDKIDKYMKDSGWDLYDSDPQPVPRGAGWDEMGYEPNPETLPRDVRVRANRVYDDYKSVVEKGGGTPVSRDEFLAEVGSYFLNDIVHDDVYTRTPATVLGQIITEGAVKTQHETGSSRGYYSPSSRTAVEGHVLNVPMDISDRLRPVYGFMSGDIENTHQYGSLMLKMHPEVAERTTVTAGDSIDDGPDAAVSLADLQNDTAKPEYRIAASLPYQYESAIEAAIRELHADDEDVLDQLPEEYWGEEEVIFYHEAQIHGGLPLEDIAEMSFDEDLKELDDGPFDDYNDEFLPEDWLDQVLGRIGFSVESLRLYLGQEGVDLYEEFVATMASLINSGEVTNLTDQPQHFQKFIEELLRLAGAENTKFLWP